MSSELGELMIVLLSVKPEFAYKIFEGTKKYEYRKVLFSDLDGDKILIYVSSPVKKIIGEIEVEEIISDSPKELWRKTGKQGGISSDFFFEYFTDRGIGHAIKIKSVRRYETPVDPYKAIARFKAPQSFAYLKDARLQRKFAFA